MYKTINEVGIECVAYYTVKREEKHRDIVKNLSKNFNKVFDSLLRLFIQNKSEEAAYETFATLYNSLRYFTFHTSICPGSLFGISAIFPLRLGKPCGEQAV